MTEISNEALAAIVISYRALGVNRDKAIAAMEELAYRRLKGNTFDYEAFIANKLSEIPKPVPANISQFLQLIHSFK